MRTVVWGLGIAVAAWVLAWVSTAVVIHNWPDSWIADELNWRIMMYPEEVIGACLFVGFVSAVTARVIGGQK